jgi:RNA-directed DNA polymerase
MINPIVAGWINYCGLFGRAQSYQLLRRINTYLMRWARNKYRRLRGYTRFHRWWTGLLDREPELFNHCNLARTFDWKG